jgi:hypothetical protein
MTHAKLLMLQLVAAGAALLAVAAVRAQDLPAEPATEQPQPAEPPPPAAATPPPSGPAIEMPPEEPANAAPAPAAAEEPVIRFGVPVERERALTRGLAPERMAQHTTVVGGYGQFNLNSLRVGPDDQNDFITHANLRRIVLFVAHPITDDIRVYSEFEWENAIACDGCNGSAEVEQAFVEWQLLGEALALRAGLILVPMGIINQWHEPPVFHGVERPQVDTVIIPTTWRELALGVTGKLSEMWQYELYFSTTLDPLRLAPEGLSPALTFGSVARADAFGVSGRIEIEPILGVIAGAAFFASDLGGNAEYYSKSGSKRDLSLPLLGYALDARIRRWGFEARAVWSQFFLPNSGDLLASYKQDGSPLFPSVETSGPIPERIEGGYIELAYDVFHLLHIGHELLPFVRLELYDTQAAVPQGYKARAELDVQEFTAGLSYRPIPQLVFKSDLQLRDRRYGLDEIQINAGFGYMF